MNLSVSVEARLGREPLAAIRTNERVLIHVLFRIVQLTFVLGLEGIRAQATFEQGAMGGVVLETAVRVERAERVGDSPAQLALERLTRLAVLHLPGENK